MEKVSKIENISVIKKCNKTKDLWINGLNKNNISPCAPRSISQKPKPLFTFPSERDFCSPNIDNS